MTDISTEMTDAEHIAVNVGSGAGIDVDAQLLYIKSGQKEIADYVNSAAKPNIDNYVKENAYPKINSYVDGTAKPNIDNYITENVKPYADSAKVSAAKAAASEQNAKTAEENALGYQNKAKDYAEQAETAAAASKEAQNLAISAKDEATAQAETATTASENATAQATTAANQAQSALTAASQAKGYAENAATSEQNALGSANSAKISANNAHTAEVNAQAVLERLGTVIKIKGRVDTVEDLPTTGNLDGDTYLVGEDGLDAYPEYYWYQNHWEFLGTSATSLAWGGITGDITKQTDLKNSLDGKQALIEDLPAIRSGAALGATALQNYVETDPVYSADKPNIALKSELFSGDYNDLKNPPEIPDTTDFVSKSGDTMTGPLDIISENDNIFLQNISSRPSVIFNIKNTDDDVTQKTSHLNGYIRDIRVSDKNGMALAIIRANSSYIGTRSLEFMAFNRINDNPNQCFLKLLVTKDGGVYTQAPACSLSGSILTTETNGDYSVRLGNGKQISWGISNTTTNLKRTITLPQPFKDINYAVMTQITAWQDTFNSGYTSCLVTNAYTTTNFTASANADVAFWWIAIGNWK